MGNYHSEIPLTSIREQLNNLLNSEELKNSQVLSQFLEFIVNEKLNGAEDHIKEYTIGVQALGKPTHFNPRLDAVVRIHAGRLRRCLKDYYNGNGKNDPIMIMIPKGTYIPKFIIPTVHEIAESNNDGTFRKPGNSDGETDTLEYYQNNELILSEHKKPRLAVFPFHNFSNDPSKDYFVNGMGEQLSIELARFQNISVISYYSTRSYSHEPSRLKELQKTIGLDYVLTGSVRFTDEFVKLNIQLHLTDSSEIIWTDTYIRRLTSDNLFDVQEDIANQVLNVIAGDNGIILQNDIAGASPFPRSTIVVKDAIYHYYNFVKSYGPDNYQSTKMALQNAVDKEPASALAYAMLSDLYIHSYINALHADEHLFESAWSLAEKAIRIDEHCQHAHKSMAWCLALKGEKSAAMEMAERCVALNPKSAAMSSAMGLCLIVLGEYAKGFNYIVRPMHLITDLPVPSKLGLACYYFIQKNYGRSMSWLEKCQVNDIPFMCLFSIAVQGKLLRKQLVNESGFMKQLAKNPELIIKRFIIDAEFQAEVMDGLRLSGFIK